MVDEPEQGPESGGDSDADDGAGAGREPGSDGSGDEEQPPGPDEPDSRDEPRDDPAGDADGGDGPDDSDPADDADSDDTGEDAPGRDETGDEEPGGDGEETGGDEPPVDPDTAAAVPDDASKPSADEDADPDDGSGGLQRAPESDQPDGQDDEPAVDDPAAGPRRPPEDAESPEREGDEPPERERPEPPGAPDGERPEPPEPSDDEQPEPPKPGDDPDDSSEPDGGVAVDRPDNMAEATPVERKTGPASDEEMPLADHVEEMVSRLFVVIAIAGVVSVAAFPFAEWLIDFLWYSVLPGGDIAQPRVYHPLSLLITELKVASLAGLIVALPVFVYETYAFMRPGLYPHERRYYLASVPMSLVLALVGVTFAYFIVLPAIFTYFLYYTETVTTIAFALSDTFNLILLLMGYLALVFQIPLFIMLAIMMGLTTRRWLEDRRLYFWGGFLGVAFLFSPDPTGMAPIMVAVTMVVLFESTLLLLRWTGR
jgi:sec-independent protein translocase protein TatC